MANLPIATQWMHGSKSGVVFTATDGQGKTRNFVESQLVADVLKYFRSMTRVVIGEAIPANDVIFLFLGERRAMDSDVTNGTG
jgi:hypothetical protein